MYLEICEGSDIPQFIVTCAQLVNTSRNVYCIEYHKDLFLMHTESTVFSKFFKYDKYDIIDNYLIYTAQINKLYDKYNKIYFTTYKYAFRNFFHEIKYKLFDSNKHFVIPIPISQNLILDSNRNINTYAIINYDMLIIILFIVAFNYYLIYF